MVPLIAVFKHSPDDFNASKLGGYDQHFIRSLSFRSDSILAIVRGLRHPDFPLRLVHREEDGLNALEALEVQVLNESLLNLRGDISFKEVNLLLWCKQLFL